MDGHEQVPWSPVASAAPEAERRHHPGTSGHAVMAAVAWGAGACSLLPVPPAPPGPVVARHLLHLGS